MDIIIILYTLPPILSSLIFILLKLYCDARSEITYQKNYKSKLIKDMETNNQTLQEELKINKEYNNSCISKELSEKNHTIKSLQKDIYYLERKVKQMENIQKKFTDVEDKLFIYFSDLQPNRYDGEEWTIVDLQQLGQKVHMETVNNHKLVFARYVSLYEDYYKLRKILSKYFGEF